MNPCKEYGCQFPVEHNQYLYCDDCPYGYDDTENKEEDHNQDGTDE